MAAEFFVGDGGTDLPSGWKTGTGDVLAGASLTALTSAGFTDVGYTQEGVEVSYEPDYGDVEVDQLLDSARIFKQSMRVTVNTTLAEATLENLLIVWGQEDDTLASDVLTIAAGQLGDAPVERALVFVGPGPRASAEKQRIYHVGRAIQTESSSHALRRSEATAFPVSFRILPGDATSTQAASYGTVRDRALA
jgi:hypothetical protein